MSKSARITEGSIENISEYRQRQNAFFIFYNNSNITFLSDSGASGILLILEWRGDRPSPYYDTETGKEVERIVLKIVGIAQDDSKDWEYDEVGLPEDSDQLAETKKHSETRESFESEAAIHQDVCLLNKSNFCPYLIHSQLYTKHESIDFLDNLLRTNDAPQHKYNIDPRSISALTQIKYAMEIDEPVIQNIGVFAIEVAAGYIGLDAFIEQHRGHPSLQKVIDEARSTALTLAMQAGYYLKDFHHGNTMVNPQGHVIIVDYGMAEKLTPEDAKKMEKLIASGNMEGAIAIICSHIGVDNTKSRDIPRGLKWLCDHQTIPSSPIAIEEGFRRLMNKRKRGDFLHKEDTEKGPSPKKGRSRKKMGGKRKIKYTRSFRKLLSKCRTKQTRKLYKK